MFIKSVCGGEQKKIWIYFVMLDYVPPSKKCGIRKGIEFVMILIYGMIYDNLEKHSIGGCCWDLRDSSE